LLSQAVDEKHIAALGAVDPNRSRDGIGQRRHSIEAGAQHRDSQVVLGFEVAVARIVGFHLERFARSYA
jgi:hypothetical protein